MEKLKLLGAAVKLKQQKFQELEHSTESIERNRLNEQSSEELKALLLTLQEGQHEVQLPQQRLEELDLWGRDVDAASVRTLIHPPLFHLDRIAQFFWSKKTYDRVFAPLKADLVREWMEAEAAGQRRKAWYIKWIRGLFMQLSRMATQAPFSIAKRVVEMFQASK
jgi:hypothetical protein